MRLDKNDYKGKYNKSCWFGQSWFFIKDHIGWDNFWRELDRAIDEKRPKISFLKAGWSDKLDVVFLNRESRKNEEGKQYTRYVFKVLDKTLNVKR